MKLDLREGRAREYARGMVFWTIGGLLGFMFICLMGWALIHNGERYDFGQILIAWMLIVLGIGGIALAVVQWIGHFQNYQDQVR